MAVKVKNRSCVTEGKIQQMIQTHSLEEDTQLRIQCTWKIGKKMHSESISEIQTFQEEMYHAC